MNIPKTKVRFDIKNQLGEGSFSKSFQAYDRKLRKEVALKVEKEDKNKQILKFEYEILKSLQGKFPITIEGDTYVPKVYELIENKNSNFIVMELLGKNIASFKKSKGDHFTNLQAYDILLQMLDSIEILHDKGYIHRDIKPTNFVIGIDERKVYMVDFGLAKKHLNEEGVPISPRPTTEFRGTLSYASLNAHNRQELSRRDDMFSFFFMILDLLNENLPWRTCTDDKDEIKKKKETCLADPENQLLLTTCREKQEILDILDHLKTLNYVDRPNYELIRKKLNDLRKAEIHIMFSSEQNTNLFNKPRLTSGSLDNTGKEQQNNSSHLLSKIASTNNISRIESNDVTIKMPNLKKKRRRFSLCVNEKDVHNIEKAEKKYTKNDYSIITDDNTLLTLNNNCNINRVENKTHNCNKEDCFHFMEFLKKVKKKNEDNTNNNPNFPGYENSYNYYSNSYGYLSNYVFPSVPTYNFMYYEPVGGRLYLNVNNLNNINSSQVPYMNNNNPNFQNYFGYSRDNFQE